MSVMSARVGSPARPAVVMMLSASACASSSSAMNAPVPHFTSITRPWLPAAIFLERIEAVMSGMDSTVAVMSRMA